MNIAHTETLYGWGGQQRKVLLECIAMKELGHNVYLICNPGSKIYDKALARGIYAILVPMSKKNYLSSIARFLRIIYSKKLDLLISHGSTDSWTAVISTKISRRGTRCFRERHNLFPIRSIASRWLHKSGADRILSISDSVTNYLLDIGVPKENISYLPDAVDPQEFEPSTYTTTIRKELNIPANAIVIGSLTSHREDKGVYDLAKFCARVLELRPNVWFIFSGPYRPHERERIESNILDNTSLRKRILWTGYTNQPQDMLNGFDIFVHLSKTEGLGTVTIEAMYSKKPVLGWKIPAMIELIENNKNGFIADYQDFDRLLSYACTLIDSRELREEFGNLNYIKSQKNYSFAALKKRIEKIICL